MNKREFVSYEQTPFRCHVSLYYTVLNMQYMRRLVNIAAEFAAKQNVPCTVSTDSLEKAMKYEHLGFSLFRKRRLSDNAAEYDMLLRPQN